MCGAKAGGLGTEGIDMATVIQGTVSAAGVPLAGAYVRLLDSSGEFTAEVPTSATGQFRFFAAPGKWALRALSPKGTAEVTVTATQGEATEVALTV